MKTYLKRLRKYAMRARILYWWQGNIVREDLFLRGMSVCLKCIGDKIEYGHTLESTDVYLPCLKYREELTNATSAKNMRELLCQAGPYQWCPE